MPPSPYAPHPYQSLPQCAFWAQGAWDAYAQLYQKKFEITQKTPLMTMGSCFAQRLGAALRQSGGQIIDQEPPPQGLSPERWAAQGYGLYSARYGNIYTARQARQLMEDALWERLHPEMILRDHRGFHDGQRLHVDLGRLATAGMVLEARSAHLAAVRRAIEAADVLILTLGLTEAWQHATSAMQYAFCPGVKLGQFDPAHHVLHVASAEEVMQDLRTLLHVAQKMKPGVKLLLTVSPVPMIATATHRHILLANQASKAALLSAALNLAATHEEIAYFPSFEIATGAGGRLAHFAANRRDITAEGVAQIMRVFFECHAEFTPSALHSSILMQNAESDAEEEEDALHCDEELLAAFAPPHIWPRGKAS